MTDLTAVNASAVTEAATLADTDFLLSAVGGVTRKSGVDAVAAWLQIDSGSAASALASAASAAASAAAAGTSSGRLDVGSFAQLSSKFNYTGTGGRQLAAAGDIVKWPEMGATYTVLASGASGADFDYTGTGGIKLNLNPQPIVDARAFGIVGGTDETSKLEVLRQFAIAYPGTTFDFKSITTKELRYTTPKWLAEVQDATVDLTGISLRNLGAGTFGYADMEAALYLGSGPYFHDDQGTGQINPAKAQSGHLFNASSAAATFITLTTAAESSNYAAGDRVMLRQLERQGAASFPPNPGFFEWAEVLTSAAGVVTFTAPLRHAYQAVAPDYTSGASYLVTNGKARILNLTRTGYTEAGTLRVIGGIGIDTGNASSAGYDGSLYISGAKHVEVTGGNFKSFFNNCSELNILKDCLFQGETTEFDKMVGKVIAERCEFDNVSQGTGVEFLEMKGCKLHGTVQIRPKNITIEDCDILTTEDASKVMVQMDSYPKKSVVLKNNRFYPASGALYGVQPGNATAVTPNAITNTLITVNTGNAAYTEMVRNIEVGNTLVLNNGKPPEVFYVTGYSFDVSGNLLIAGLCEVASPGAGARNMFFSQSLTVAGNRVISPPAKFRIIRPSKRHWHTESDTPGKVSLSVNMQYGEYAVFTANCYVDQVIVDVVKPYTGSDAACTLSTAVQGAGQTQAFISANGKTAGRRMINQIGQYGAVGGDTLTALPNQAWCEDFVVHLQGSGGTGTFTDGDFADLPIIRVTLIGYKPPLNQSEA